jgi:N-acetylated-alpha-linked acidic dipeptidase
MFDTFNHYSKFMDPGFDYGLALTQVCGRLTLRLAQADELPFDFRSMVRVIEQYIAEVEKLADTLRAETAERNQWIDDGLYAQADDPEKKLVAPKKQAPVPHINFAPLLNAVATLKTSVEELRAARDAWAAGAKKLEEPQQRQLDQILYRAEQVLLDDAGLLRRPWFRHQIYAPGFYTGYGVKTLPGVRESIEERQWDAVAGQVEAAAAAIERLARQIDAAHRLYMTSASISVREANP